jgi:hypothetical protein
MHCSSSKIFIYIYNEVKVYLSVTEKWRKFLLRALKYVYINIEMLARTILDASFFLKNYWTMFK